MPTYQYRCTECGHDLEAVQKFTDASLTECSNCGGPLRKIFNAVGVVFKGSGFYRNDSREANKVNAESGSQESGGKDGGKDSGKDGKDSGKNGKDSGKKESGASTPAKAETNGSSSTPSAPAKSDSTSGSGAGKQSSTASSTGSSSSSG